MKNICACCNKEFGPVSFDFIPDSIITRGICDDCADMVLWPKRSALMDFLDSLGEPVIVVDTLVNATSANTQACKLLQKSLSDIVGLKGGVVFECAFAKLPGGCGNTVHCDGCTIRKTVMDTFQTSKSHLRVPAGLTHGTANNYVEIQCLISTEKVKDVVLLRIDKVRSN